MRWVSLATTFPVPNIPNLVYHGFTLGRKQTLLTVPDLCRPPEIRVQAEENGQRETGNE